MFIVAISANIGLRFIWGCACLPGFSYKIPTSELFSAALAPRRENQAQIPPYNTWGGAAGVLKNSVAPPPVIVASSRASAQNLGGDGVYRPYGLGIETAIAPVPPPVTPFQSLFIRVPYLQALFPRYRLATFTLVGTFIRGWAIAVRLFR